MSPNIYRQLKEMYAENNMPYHDWSHITDCLIEFNKCRNSLNSSDQVVTAILFHDAVYDPKAKDNEEKSAELAVKILTEKGLSNDFTSKVSNLVLATKHIVIPEDNDSKFILDIDLSILGANKEKYDTYAKAIRKEYSMYSDQEYNTGRTAVLQGFLDRKRIFLTDFFKDLYHETNPLKLHHEKKLFLP